LGRKITVDPEEAPVKYMLQIYGNITREQFAAMDEDQRNALYADWGAVSSAPGVTPGVQIAEPATATTVRVQDGRTLTTDGPFVATKEALGGWFILEADDLDAAIALAARVPTARMGGAVEIRPVVYSCPRRSSASGGGAFSPP
jgi:hypothetical protein